MNTIKDLLFSSTDNNDDMSEYERWSEALDNVRNIRENSAARLRPQRKQEGKEGLTREGKSNLSSQSDVKQDHSLDPHRWYKMVLQQEAADKKADEDAEKRIRKKLRQKGENLKQERWKQERLEQDKLEEIQKRSIKENREAQAKARVEERTKKASTHRKGSKCLP